MIFNFICLREDEWKRMRQFPQWILSSSQDLIIVLLPSVIEVIDTLSIAVSRVKQLRKSTTNECVDKIPFSFYPKPKQKLRKWRFCWSFFGFKSGSSVIVRKPQHWHSISVQRLHESNEQWMAVYSWNLGWPSSSSISFWVILSWLRWISFSGGGGNGSSRSANYTIVKSSKWIKLSLSKSQNAFAQINTTLASACSWWSLAYSVEVNEFHS